MNMTLVIIVLIICIVIGAFLYTNSNNGTRSPTVSSTAISSVSAVTSGPSTVSSTTTMVNTQGQGTNSSGTVNIGYYSFSLSALAAVTVTSNPVNLSQIAQISKFRSCFGHDFSGYNFNGTAELGASMKHYFNILPSLRYKSHTVQIFAPFNGTLIFDNKTLDYPNGDQIVIKSAQDPIMGVEIFHIDLLPGITAGTQVNSGQLIGYKNATEYSGFDIAYGPISPDWPCSGRCSTPMASIWDSIFNHMATSVLSQYDAVGINQSAIIIPKSARDVLPCNYPNDTQYGFSSVGSPYAGASWNFANVTNQNQLQGTTTIVQNSANQSSSHSVGCTNPGPGGICSGS